MRFQLQALRKRARGSVLIEVSIGFAVLIIVSLMLMRLSMAALASRTWVVRQTLSDAYCTRESALAKRVPFAALDAMWPTGADNALVSTPNMGTLGVDAGSDAARAVTGTLSRYKTVLNVNLPSTVGDAALPNPASGTSFLLTSVLSYNIGGQVYYKTRSTVRTQ